MHTIWFFSKHTASSFNIRDFICFKECCYQSSWCGVDSKSSLPVQQRCTSVRMRIRAHRLKVRPRNYTAYAQIMYYFTTPTPLPVNQSFSDSFCHDIILTVLSFNLKVLLLQAKRSLIPLNCCYFSLCHSQCCCCNVPIPIRHLVGNPSQILIYDMSPRITMFIVNLPVQFVNRDPTEIVVQIFHCFSLDVVDLVARNRLIAMQCSNGYTEGRAASHTLLCKRAHGSNIKRNVSMLLNQLHFCKSMTINNIICLICISLSFNTHMSDKINKINK